MNKNVLIPLRANTLKAVYFILIAFIVSCTKNNNPETLIIQSPDSTAILKYRGIFQPTSGITISGFAKVYQKNNTYQVNLDSFSVSKGPDLKVYLSREYPPANFINLGPLQSTSGMQVYNIPGQPDFSAYKYVLIHCQQYNHLFGIAALYW